MNLPKPNPILIVLSGPSGAGKDFILNILKTRPIANNLAVMVTNTTRPMRAGEVQDANYHFVTPAKFRQMIAADELLEYANVYGNWYGVPKEPVRTALDAGRDAIIKVDVQGARTIKSHLPEAVLIFLAPASLDELAERLQKRNTESPSDLAHRLKTAEAEMAEASFFDYVVVNGDGQAKRVIAELEAIIAAEKLRHNPRK